MWDDEDEESQQASQEDELCRILSGNLEKEDPNGNAKAAKAASAVVAKPAAAVPAKIPSKPLVKTQPAISKPAPPQSQTAVKPAAKSVAPIPKSSAPQQTNTKPLLATSRPAAASAKPLNIAPNASKPIAKSEATKPAVANSAVAKPASAKPAAARPAVAKPAAAVLASAASRPAKNSKSDATAASMPTPETLHAPLFGNFEISDEEAEEDFEHKTRTPAGQEFRDAFAELSADDTSTTPLMKASSKAGSQAVQASSSPPAMLTATPRVVQPPPWKLQQPQQSKAPQQKLQQQHQQPKAVNQQALQLRSNSQPPQSKASQPPPQQQQPQEAAPPNKKTVLANALAKACEKVKGKEEARQAKTAAKKAKKKVKIAGKKESASAATAKDAAKAGNESAVQKSSWKHPLKLKRSRESSTTAATWSQDDKGTPKKAKHSAVAEDGTNPTWKYQIWGRPKATTLKRKSKEGVKKAGEPSKKTTKLTDAMGRTYDFNSVVVNFANIGTNYGRVRMKRSGRGMFDWEGVRTCVMFLTKVKGLTVTGVIDENFKGTDCNFPTEGVPADIAKMCKSIEETPRIQGIHQKSADDEMTIKCAFRRNCCWLDNDNYRDWKQQLRDARIRRWLLKSQDILHMRYYFDSDTGSFDLLEGNYSRDLLATGQEVSKRELSHAPRGY
eukprot:TRINITY_DN17702_c2_g1_i2.p1 TRINITY_DN17702_c2_g1~~TRINITY_DN17702_c2_g1_i2.p1  ORF type:complete len:670 (-),score=184.72 TRINITY_DN17702_c2_g1_i2:274-2283(-)